MTQSREKWNYLVLRRADIWMVRSWCHDIRIFIFIFLSRPNCKKEHLDENYLHHGYGNYFESAILKVTWHQLCSKFFLNINEAHWQWHLKDTLQLKIIRQWIRIRVNSSLANVMKRKWTNVPEKQSVVQKSEPVLWRTVHLLLYSFSLKQTYVLNSAICSSNFCHNLFTFLAFDIQCIMEFIPCLGTFFYKKQ